MSRYDATQSNESKRSAKIYRDLDLDFQFNSATKDIQKLTDVESVKRSVRNLINTNHYERPFHPELGSGIRELLFENVTPLTEIFLAKKVEEILIEYEPRIKLVSVNVTSQPDNNRFAVVIEFYVINHPEPVIIDTFLERLR